MAIVLGALALWRMIRNEGKMKKVKLRHFLFQYFTFTSKWNFSQKTFREIITQINTSQGIGCAVVVPARKLFQLQITNYANNSHRIGSETCNGLFAMDMYLVVVSYQGLFPSCQA